MNMFINWFIYQIFSNFYVSPWNSNFFPQGPTALDQINYKITDKLVNLYWLKILTINYSQPIQGFL